MTNFVTKLDDKGKNLGSFRAERDLANILKVMSIKLNYLKKQVINYLLICLILWWKI